MRTFSFLACAAQIYGVVAQLSQEPCAIVAAAVASRGDRRSVAVAAQDAWACLQSVPFDQANAQATVKNIIQLVQFHSNLLWIKDPPAGFPNPPVDVLQGIQLIGQRVDAAQYANEYQFEADVRALLGSALDGHLTFEGYTFGGAFAWLRERTHSLISASVNGQTPQVFLTNDYNTTDASFVPSAIAQINDRPVMDFLRDEAAVAPYHDADTRWNSLFVLQSIESGGIFISPNTYPGPTTSFVFENGTSTQIQNLAFVQDPEKWASVTDGTSFYQTFVLYRPDAQAPAKRQVPQPATPNPSRFLPKKFEWNGYRPLLREGLVPETYPDPIIQHSSGAITLGGFHLDTTLGRVAVLVLQTFFTEDIASTREWQSVLSSFITQTKAAGIERIVLDMRTNGGGKIFLGYEAFKQFFPGIEPFGASRIRMSEGVQIMGNAISTLPLNTNTASIYTTPFNHHSFLSSNLTTFADWSTLTGGPVSLPSDDSGTDTFTNLLRYNLTDPLLITSPDYGLGISISSTPTVPAQSSPPLPPFARENIIMLTDGICASTCALFAEMMRSDGGVRSISMGGRPAPGPMQPVGGTKGALVVDWDFLDNLSQYTLDTFGPSTAPEEVARWRDVLPLWGARTPGSAPGITPSSASINFQVTMRSETDEIPTQFRTEYASCRMWYEPRMYTDVTSVWTAVAETAWGGPNSTINAARCVEGSVVDEGLTGQLPQDGSSPAASVVPGGVGAPPLGNTMLPPTVVPGGGTGQPAAPLPPAVPIGAPGQVTVYTPTNITVVMPSNSTTTLPALNGTVVGNGTVPGNKTLITDPNPGFTPGPLVPVQPAPPAAANGAGSVRVGGVSRVVVAVIAISIGVFIC